MHDVLKQIGNLGLVPVVKIAGPVLIGRAKICCGVCADGCKRYGLAITGALVEAGVGVSPVEVVGAAKEVVAITGASGTLTAAGALTVPLCGQMSGGAL